MNSPDPLGLGLGKSHTRDSWIDEKWFLAQKNEEKRREKRRKRKKAEVFVSAPSCFGPSSRRSTTRTRLCGISVLIPILFTRSPDM